MCSSNTANDSGISNCVTADAPDILNDAGFSASDSLTQSIYIGVTKLVMVVVALAVMDKFGMGQVSCVYYVRL
jgi:hypothetical protein